MLSLLLWCLLLPALARPAGEDLEVSLLTFGPGDQIYQAAGHDGIRVLDHRKGTDRTYHWGVFDRFQEDFALRFLGGRMLYRMDRVRTEKYLAKYPVADRSVWEQVLDLDPAQRAELSRLAEINHRPANRDYLYAILDDNCSTRVRDLLDQVLGGALRAQLGARPDRSFRFHNRRLGQDQPTLWLGIDLLLGPEGDRPLTQWEAAYMPLRLRDVLREVTMEGRPLVREERELYRSTGRPSSDWPHPLWPLPVAGLSLGVALVGLGVGAEQRWARRGIVAVVGTWSLVAGALGLVLAGTWLTDHDYFHWNETLLQLSPLSMVVLALLPWPRVAARAALVPVALAVLGLLAEPVLTQVNGEWIALALPAHLAVAWALRQRAVWTRTRR